MSQNCFKPPCLKIEAPNVRVVYAKSCINHQITDAICSYLTAKDLPVYPYCHAYQVICNGSQKSKIHLINADEHQRLLYLRSNAGFVITAISPLLHKPILQLDITRYLDR